MYNKQGYEFEMDYYHSCISSGKKKNNCNLSLKIKMHYFRKKKRKNLEFSKKGREINYDSMDFMFRLNY